MVIEIASGRRRPVRHRRRQRSRVSFWPALAGAVIFAVLAGFGLAPDTALDDLLDAATPNRGDIVLAGGVQVTDGDTFRIGDERVRVENIDTPELGDGAECLAERRLADVARQHAGALLASGELRVERTGADQYGRTLARVAVGGQDFGRAMIAAGLAEPWTGRRVDWCR